jgi:hypothetical protein
MAIASASSSSSFVARFDGPGCSGVAWVYVGGTGRGGGPVGDDGDNGDETDVADCGTLPHPVHKPLSIVLERCGVPARRDINPTLSPSTGVSNGFRPSIVDPGPLLVND